VLEIDVGHHPEGELILRIEFGFAGVTRWWVWDGTDEAAVSIATGIPDIYRDSSALFAMQRAHLLGVPINEPTRWCLAPPCSRAVRVSAERDSPTGDTVSIGGAVDSLVPFTAALISFWFGVAQIRAGQRGESDGWPFLDTTSKGLCVAFGCFAIAIGVFSLAVAVTRL
jgi:hypothetical protein